MQISSISFAESKGLKALIIPYVHDYIFFSQRKLGDIRKYRVNPFDFINLIKHAELIITDSFHAVIFSTIYHKPFYTFKRDSESQFIGRVENFLRDTHLEKQMISLSEVCSKDIPSIDYFYADTHINKQRLLSIKFLEDSIFE